ncbi:MAG: bifunctional methylenetetrahydrofolate dehydrogenase/methenyltetrahydrofolate cyclohydrolase FolD [Saprospiraceae bacterium]
MKLLDGKALATLIKNEVAVEVESHIALGNRAPHLVAVLVGDHPASASYVRNKIKSCREVGFKSTIERLDNSTTQAELLAVVDKLNDDPEVDGFIVQLPLPPHIDDMAVTLAIDPRKDVDGFHPVNFGRMAQGLDAYLPATPFGILQLLERYDIETSGKHAVVLGRSNIVGTPISILLSRKSKTGNATVTLTHSRTKNLAEVLKTADILVAAIGSPEYVTADMVKEGAVVIDVGINRVEDASKKRGYRLVGDVDFAGVKDKVSAITPVPGGVGPMTVISLIQNTFRAAKDEVYEGINTSF